MLLRDLLNVLHKFGGTTEVKVTALTVDGVQVVKSGKLAVTIIPGKGKDALHEGTQRPRR